MTARSGSDLAADVRVAIRPRGPIAGEERIRQSERDKVAKALATLDEFVERLEAAEADARSVRKKMEHNAGNLDFAIQQRQELEAQVAALTQEPDYLRERGDRNEWDIEVGATNVVCPQCAFTFDKDHTDRDGGYSCPVCNETRLEKQLSDTRRALEMITLSRTHYDACAIARRALAATGGGTSSEGRGNREHLSSAKAATPPDPEGGGTGQEQQP